MRGTAPLQQLTLRQGIDKNGKAWTDHHFAETAANTYHMSMILTNLVIWQQFLCNVRELAVVLNRLPSVGPSAHWQEGRGIRPNPFYQQGVTLRAEHAAAEKAAEAAKIQEEKYEKLSVLCGLPRIPMKGDYFRSGVDGSTVFEDRDLEFVAGKIIPKKVFGPILNFASFRKDTAEDFFAGLSVMSMHQTPPDANQKVT